MEESVWEGFFAQVFMESGYGLLMTMTGRHILGIHSFRRGSAQYWLYNAPSRLSLEQVKDMGGWMSTEQVRFYVYCTNLR